jgi:hypothetical protein
MKRTPRSHRTAGVAPIGDQEPLVAVRNSAAKFSSSSDVKDMEVVVFNGHVHSGPKNTASWRSVARSSYIHPSVIKAYEKGKLEASLFRGRLRTGLNKIESALMRFLETSQSSPPE